MRTLRARFKDWDHKTFRRFSSMQSRLLDNTLVPLGRAADSSRLWMGFAAILAVAGARRSRRAALRGVLSIAITSAVTNGPLKMLARRTRPTAELIRRRFGRLPTSSSFPSGHAASAAAFATGVALELPPAGIPVGTLAAGVAASRVYAGVHYPSDVLAGTAVGSLLALWMRRFWPVASRQPARAQPVLTGVETLASPDGEGITFVVNLSAGSVLARPPEEELKEELASAEVIVAEGPEDFDRALEKASHARAIGIAGGDGSINAAAEVAVEHDCPLVVVPAGTLNHLARDLGIESVRDAIDAVKHGNAAAVDVATIDGKCFLNTASFGSYVELVDAREKLEGKIGKWPAVMVALTRVLRSSQPVEVEIDGRRRTIWMIFIGNCKYHPSGFAPSWRQRLDDGLLDVRTVDASHSWARTRLLFAVLSGTLGTCRVYEHMLVTELRVKSVDGKPMRLARDGETFEGSREFTVRKLDKRLPIYVPLP
jgi:diacylglycerol kinase family enzyme/membrane-associated phospholipid phosphatase